MAKANRDSEEETLYAQDLVGALSREMLDGTLERNNQAILSRMHAIGSPVSVPPLASLLEAYSNFPGDSNPRIAELVAIIMAQQAKIDRLESVDSDQSREAKRPKLTGEAPSTSTASNAQPVEIEGQLVLKPIAGSIFAHTVNLQKLTQTGANAKGNEVTKSVRLMYEALNRAVGGKTKLLTLKERPRGKNITVPVEMMNQLMDYVLTLYPSLGERDTDAKKMELLDKLQKKLNNERGKKPAKKAPELTPISGDEAGEDGKEEKKDGGDVYVDEDEIEVEYEIEVENELED